MIMIIIAIIITIMIIIIMIRNYLPRPLLLLFNFSRAGEKVPADKTVVAGRDNCHDDDALYRDNCHDYQRKLEWLVCIWWWLQQEEDNCWLVTIPASHSNSSPVSESQPEQDEENQEDCGEDGRQRIVPDGDLIPNKETLSPKYSLGCIYTSVSSEKLFSPVWEYVAQRSNLHLLFFFVPHLSWSSQEFWAPGGA